MGHNRVSVTMCLSAVLSTVWATEATRCPGLGRFVLPAQCPSQRAHDALLVTDVPSDPHPNPPLSLPPAWSSLLPRRAPRSAAGPRGPGCHPPHPFSLRLAPPASSHGVQAHQPPEVAVTLAPTVTPSPACPPGSTGQEQSLAFVLGDTRGEPQLNASSCGTPAQEQNVCLILPSAFLRA